ncbi:MAG: carbohydrate ABC transporter substrate-binding protein, partial [Anaerolineales bacterium]
MGKRTWLAWALLVALIASACGPAATPAPGTEGPPEPAGTEPAGGGEVEVFSWWTAGGEADGLAAMVEVFGAEYPQFTFV